jgi:hypothetical protein
LQVAGSTKKAPVLSGAERLIKAGAGCRVAVSNKAELAIALPALHSHGDVHAFVSASIGPFYPDAPKACATAAMGGEVGWLLPEHRVLLVPDC